MFRLLLRPILLLTLLAALPIFAIRAQRYDDSELRAFLTPPEGCPPPCFMGIRPGVTTVDEALAILDSSSLFMYTRYEIDPDHISLQLKNPHNLIVDSDTNSLFLENNVVQRLDIQTNILVGELWATYGQPDWGSRAYSMGSSRIYYEIGYNQNDIGFGFFIHIETIVPTLQHVVQSNLMLRLDPNMEKNTNNMEPRLWHYTSRDLSWWDCC